MKNMHSVSDDDFDKLFQDRLYSYEAEPNDAVWAGITEQLGTRKKKQPFPILTIAAASMAAFIGFGIWLAETKEPMRLSGKADRISTESPVVESAAPAIAKREVVTEKSVALKSLVAKIAPAPVQKNDPVSRPKSEIKTPTSLKVAALNSSSETALGIDEPIERNEDKSNTSVISGKSSLKEAVMLSLAPETEIQPEEVEQYQKQKRIKSVGSLVNFVVSKVDKRKEKIIEFEDGDEGTKVSGLNLGLLKFKAKD